MSHVLNSGENLSLKTVSLFKNAAEVKQQNCDIDIIIVSNTKIHGFHIFCCFNKNLGTNRKVNSLNSHQLESHLQLCIIQFHVSWTKLTFGSAWLYVPSFQFIDSVVNLVMRSSLGTTHDLRYAHWLINLIKLNLLS